LDGISQPSETGLKPLLEGGPARWQAAGHRLGRFVAQAATERRPPWSSGPAGEAAAWSDLRSLVTAIKEMNDRANGTEA